jgi:hypothetical protein
MSKKFKPFGDETIVSIPSTVVDCSRLGFFDEMEEECWALIKKYAELFGVEIVPEDPNEDDEVISFDKAKAVQDLIIEFFEDSGIKFNF